VVELAGYHVSDPGRRQPLSGEPVNRDERRSSRWRKPASGRTKSVLPVATFRSGRVPRVAEVSPYGIVGVTPSKYLQHDPLPPYVSRDVDHLLDELLRQRGVALVTGASKAGKSRTTFEAVRRVFPASKLVVPTACTKALTSLLGDPPFGRSPDPPVLWLDEVDRFLGDVTGFDHALLDWLERGDGRMVIVGTVNLTRRDDLLATEGQIGRAARLLLEQADQILVPTQPSRRERAEAERLYPDQQFVRGIGEELVDTAALEREYDTGRTAAPVGWALVRAAVDWRRAGMLRPIPEADLKDLCLRYLDAVVPTAAQHAEGLTWACRRLAPQIALLRVTGRPRFPSFHPFDHIVAYADWHIAGPARKIPHGSWELIAARASPEEAARVGFTAYSRGDHPAADAAWSRASASGDQEVAPWAAQQLRELRGRPRHSGLARPALERRREPRRSTSVANSTHPSRTASEIPRLGSPLARLGGPPRARQPVLEYVLAARRPEAPPVAGRTEDLPLEEQGRDDNGS
jgi:cellulose synthase operon protein C